MLREHNDVLRSLAAGSARYLADVEGHFAPLPDREHPFTLDLVHSETEGLVFIVKRIADFIVSHVLVA